MYRLHYNLYVQDPPSREGVEVSDSFEPHASKYTNSVIMVYSLLSIELNIDGKLFCQIFGDVPVWVT